MSGARNKQRGYEHEREIVLWAQAQGFDCRRIFGSGAYKAQLGEDFAGDIVLEGLRSDVVCVRADRKERLWIVKDDLFAKLMKGELTDD